MKKPKKTFHIHRLINGEWKFWMFTDAVSEKQAASNVWWKNKKIPRHEIRATEGPIPLITSESEGTQAQWQNANNPTRPNP